MEAASIPETPTGAPPRNSALQVLSDNANINRGGPLKAGETHTIEESASGPPRVVRKRFSAT